MCVAKSEESVCLEGCIMGASGAVGLCSVSIGGIGVDLNLYSFLQNSV